ncbi:vWA domain-containing protein [Nitriliruptor alkaliphilus]|uniref:vWA domain-containing protein n=1 Tax=Nitriliruptor alkaliphilus TaxID=427918 RepID=UPI000AB7A932|nr:VWA domain-containing protein [Nitriliruptor alkaliphilus]
MGDRPVRAAGDLAPDLTASAVGLARTLRAAGVDASPERVHAFLTALGMLGAEDRQAVYWAGRVTMCAGPDDVERYDRVFAAFFDGESVTGRAVVRRRVNLGPQALGDAVGGTGDDEVPTVDAQAVTRRASRQELLRHRDVSDLDDRERTELHRLLAAFAMPGEQRRTRRQGPAVRGGVDRRRSVRALLRAGGEIGRLHRQAPQQRPRRVVLLVDVSGSMAGYADVLLRFAHVAARRHTGHVEVFTLGTRLTRVTEPMSHRDPDTAMRAVSAAIPDWAGGTRLGEGLRAFLDTWGQRGTARGAVVVILSDGWETGDVAVLGEQVARLSRLSHRLIWANPRAGREGFAPTAGGMAAALPHCDDLVEGHSMAALEQLARVVAGAQAADRQRGVPGRRTVVAGSGGWTGA